MEEKIALCLWYNGQAPEAGRLYCSVLADAKITAQSPVVTEINVSGQSITLLNGGPMYQPNPSISLYYSCNSVEEFDRVWDAFSKDGTVMMAADRYTWSEKYGWLSDKFNISWQIGVHKPEDIGQKITPCLMFTGAQYGRVDEAIAHYSSIFRSSSVDGVLRYGGNEQPDEEGKVKHAQITLNGRKFMLMESAHAHSFTFTEGISLTVYCETQEAVDHYWDKLTESGKESRCGWLVDKFGVSWQIIPTVLGKLMSDPTKAGKTVQAFMGMRKFNIEQLVQASME